MQTQRKKRTGKVVSDKMDKTVVVLVEQFVCHPLYGRRVKHSKRYQAHDENNQCRIGDKVKIAETRPLSKKKRWRIVKVLEKTQEI